MSFISVFIPVVMIAFGCFVSLNSMSVFERGTVQFRMMMSAGVSLCLAGAWLEFCVSQATMTELVLRVLVVIISIAGVVAVSVAKDYDVDYDYYNSEVNACLTIFRAKTMSIACVFMTLVLSSIIASI